MTWPHLTVRLRECWIKTSNLRQSCAHPDWTTEPTIHSVVVEYIEVERAHRRQGECRRFLEALCADSRFEMVVVEAVQNPRLADALMRWDWEFDLDVMDFYKRQRGAA